MVVSIENVVGGTGADTLTGDGGDNVLNGYLGNDTLVGGAGNDTADYSYTTVGMNVTLNGAGTVMVTVAASDTDSLVSIENIAGGTGNDTLTGDAGSNVLTGNAGNDTLRGGIGSDVMIGGDGSDVFVFAYGTDNVGGPYVDAVTGDGGGGAGSWIDAISLSGVSGGPGGGDWTLNFSAGGIASSGSGQVDLTADAQGSITFADGSTMTFNGIERITY